MYRLSDSEKKIKNGYEILKSHGIEPEIFFAPSHKFDENTLQALKTETLIRVISDTIANDTYYDKSFYFIPQQSGMVRKLPFRLITFCYHPNVMNDNDFAVLKSFLEKHNQQFTSYSESLLKKRKKSAVDKILKYLYFIRR